jgi:HAD superfamily hydrolase (TIGR01490 family)
MLPKAFELIQSHREQGDFLMIITATNRFVTEPIAEAFQVDTLIATEPEMIHQKYTGRVAGIPSFKEGKIIRLNQWLEDQHHTIDGAYFYSDSHNDIPLLKLVDNPVAIDPDELLRITCEQNNWPIRSLRD